MLVDQNQNDLYLAYCRATEASVRRIDEKMGPYRAEIVPGAKASWYALLTAPSHENIAAVHLSARGFGIYLPEFEITDVRRGRMVTRTRLLLPGYLFVYVWDVARHTRRIHACPGVHGFMTFGEQVLALSWDVINEIRVIENLERPLSLPMDVVAAPRKKNRRWRRSRIAHTETVQVPNEILCVHAYSPFIEAMRRAGLDDEDRIKAFHHRLGLGS